MRTLKILGFFLSYPDHRHQEMAVESYELLALEKWLDARTIKDIGAFFAMFNSRNLLDIQEDYVALFDRTPSLSLHLFEHVHGDSRDRGQALADLLQVYKDAGLSINIEETPDYLPLFLEYTSTLIPQEASETLGSVVDILSSLALRLKNRDSLYATILEGLVAVASQKPSKKVIDSYLEKSSGAMLTTQEIDKTWEEQFAFEQSGRTINQVGSCPVSEEMLERIKNIQSKEQV